MHLFCQTLNWCCQRHLLSENHIWQKIHFDYVYSCYHFAPIQLERRRQIFISVRIFCNNFFSHKTICLLLLNRHYRQSDRENSSFHFVFCVSWIGINLFGLKCLDSSSISMAVTWKGCAEALNVEFWSNPTT